MSGLQQSFETVTTPKELARLVAELGSASRYALDTEFHRERTYWPRLALVQVAWQEPAEPEAGPDAGPDGNPQQTASEPAEPGAGEPGAGGAGAGGVEAGGLQEHHGPGPDGPGRHRVALIDPQAVDPAPLAEVLAGPGVMVAHAASQDLEVLARACGVLPGKLFDTQVAAGFAGHGSASLASLVDRNLHVRLAKGDRLTDWSRRPLTASQMSYAASDVCHLLRLADVISAQLRSRGRLSWAEEECAALLKRPSGPGDPSEAWWRLRDNRQLQGQSRGVAQQVAAWREVKAREQDIPPRMVLPDLALLSIANSPPSNLSALREVRGIDPRHLRGGADTELMEAVASGRALPLSALRAPQVEQVSKELRPAVALASAWVAQLSKDEEVDAALLATRADIVEYLSGRPGARLGEGWRAKLVGVPLRRLAKGEASLALDGHGRLLLEDRPRPT